MVAGQYSSVLGTALVELVATHFASVRPDMRYKAYEVFWHQVDEVIPERQKYIFPDDLARAWRR